MNTQLNNIQEVFNEFELIKNNIVWYRFYNDTVTVQLCYLYKKKYYLSGKPRVYTFSTLNLLNHFTNMLENCKLHKVKK